MLHTMTMEYGTITGRLVAAVADTPDDPDVNPDIIPITGTVTFTPSVKAILVASESVTVVPAPIVASLDANGYVSLNGVQSVTVLATTSTYYNPNGWTYKVSFDNLAANGRRVTFDSYNIEVPVGATVDLSSVTPITGSTGTPIVRGPRGDTGPQGPQGDPGPSDTQVATYFTSPSSTRTAADARYVNAVIASGPGIDPTGAADSSAALQAKIDTGKPVVFPAGTYAVNVPLERVTKLLLMSGATIKATAAMSAVVRTDIATTVIGGVIEGHGTIDANDLADTPIHIRWFVGFDIGGIRPVNGRLYGIRIGDTGSTGRSAEANLHNLHIVRSSPFSVRSGSHGIHVENSGDHALSSIVVCAFDIGVSLPVSGNSMLRDVHVWTPPAQGATTTAFEDRSSNSHYLQCHADTPTQFGFRLYGYQTTLVQCGTYNNPNDSNATDNVVVGVKLEAPNAIATIVGHFFLGSDATHRLAADVVSADGNYDLVTIIPLVGQFTVITNARRARFIGLDARDSVTSRTGLAVNPNMPTAAGLALRTNSKDRWQFTMDGAAESGSNAGSGLSLRRYDDTGTFIDEVLSVARASGNVAMRKSFVMSEGANFAVGSTTGSMLGTAATQKLSFFGLAPTAQPTALGSTVGSSAAGTGSAVTVDSTFTGNYGTTQYTITDVIYALKKLGLLKG